MLKDKQGKVLTNGIHITDGLIVILLSSEFTDSLKNKEFSLHNLHSLKSTSHDVDKRLEYQVIEVPDMPNFFVLRIGARRYLGGLELEGGPAEGDQVIAIGLDEGGSMIIERGLTMERKILEGEIGKNVAFPLNSTSLGNLTGSGGGGHVSFPVFNRYGQLKGLSLSVNSGEVSKNRIYYMANADFAPVVGLIRGGSPIERTHLGLSLKNSSDDSGGAFVVKISLESPFEKAGLKMGDVIVGVNGARVSDIGALSKIIGYRRDQILNVLVNRDNKIIEFQLSL